MFENGRTGEFFFNDVTDISDEISNIQLSRVDDFEDNTDETNEGLEADMELAEAPAKTTGGSGKFIQNLKNHNLAKAPGGKSGGSTSDIENLADHELAEAPVKTSSSTKDPKGVSGNHDLAEAPGGSAKGSPKFIEDLKDHNLAMVESQKNLPLVKAPAGKKEKTKGVIKGKKGHMAVAPGNHKKNGKKDHEPLDRATLAKAPATKKN
jgi:hypothetical protein